LPYLKGLLREIFGPVFWAVWMHLGLIVNRFWIFNFYDVPSIFDGHLGFMRFRPKLLRDSQNLGEGLATVFTVLQENLTVLQAS
jgi:hypothetical protein